MRNRFLIFGTIGLALVCSVGLLNMGFGTAQPDLSAFDELIVANPTLKDVATNPEQYLDQTVTVEGYAIHWSNGPWSTIGGEFFLTETLERPAEVGIWVMFAENAEVVPGHVPSSTNVVISGEVVFVQEPTTLYRIEAQRLEILPEPELILPQPANTLELFTDKEAYKLGEDVILTFVNHSPEGTVVELPNSFPLEIEFQGLDGKHTTYSLPSAQVIIPVATGERKIWTLSESQGLMDSPGCYEVFVQVYVNGNLEIPYTKFKVGMYQERPHLELFTDKITYELGEEVVLTFVNHGPEGLIVQLPNGAPFEIEFQGLDGTQAIYTLPAIEVLIVVPAGGTETWILTESEGLGDVRGYYQLNFHVYIGEQQLETLYTRFTVGADPSGYELFTDKDEYIDGENVTLTFINNNPIDSRSIHAGYCFEIIYRKQIDERGTIYGIPCIEIVVTVPFGENITWILTPAELKGPGYYVISYSFYRGELHEVRETEFTIIPEEPSNSQNDAFFVPGFGILTTFLAMLAAPLVQSRRKC